MHIAFIELANFRKLKATRIDFAERQTLFVGSNNSGKTSALVALRLFLKERGGFSTRDVTLSNWRAINAIGEDWRTLPPDAAPDAQALIALLPSLDVWLEVEDAEIYHVSHLLPTLDWTGGKIGVRLRLEPKDIEALVTDYRDARQKAVAKLTYYKTKQKQADGFELWPSSLHDYLDRRFGSALTLKAYTLDPDAVAENPPNNVAAPQSLPATTQPLDGDPLARLLHIREISAQRGFSDATQAAVADEDDASYTAGGNKRRLSDQLRAYYARHLNPVDDPSDDDVAALGAFHGAQITFDEKLAAGFKHAIEELEHLGYPGLANPKLTISTRIKPTDGLNHPSAVQYDLAGAGAEDGPHPARLPEDYNGLGFQNLISMVFLLMRFRADWMRVGKLGQSLAPAKDSAIQPLQLVLVEEPEAHLHAQVQQVFIRKAYDVLRNHTDLGVKHIFRTQFIVSTHSSHIAHEVEFASVRYFKRLPAATPHEVPSSVVANLTTLFGGAPETHRFVTRYLQTTHCDLFFADGAILIEGAAERILIPHFIRTSTPVLAEHYISLLEIGGSHAHRLKPLIELLGIPSLVITDLDAVEADPPHKAARPRLGTNLKSANPVLKSWIPGKEDIDDLLAPETVKTQIGEGHGVIHVAYQQPIEMTLTRGKATETVIPSTFEDALVLANPQTLKSLSGVAMTNSIAQIIADATTPTELCECLLERLRKNADKAGFALDLLDLPDLGALVPPSYVASGLGWLQSQLKTVQEASPLADQVATPAEAAAQ